MAADQPFTDNTAQAGAERMLTMLALFDRESQAADLLERLRALGIDVSETAIVRVDNSPAPAPARELADNILASPMRAALTGAIIGSAVGFLCGALLLVAILNGAFQTDGVGWQTPGRMELLSTTTGALTGAIIGFILARVYERQRLARQKAMAAVGAADARRDGFLIVVKTPARLGEQAESIARRVGAREIVF
ncbi:MAG: hypothetical protein ACKV2V_08510 [Blastocatellia bacterium]